MASVVYIVRILGPCSVRCTEEGIIKACAVKDFANRWPKKSFSSIKVRPLGVSQLYLQTQKELLVIFNSCRFH